MIFAEGRDADGDGCDTRDEVLLAESAVDPTPLNGCNDVAGEWFSLYDGETRDFSGGIEIDHVVALKEAWDSGAWAWTPDQRANFANDLDDPRTLRAVTSSANQTKGDKDPSNWLPSDPSAVCELLGDWVAIKARWKLSMDQSEWGRIKNLLSTGDCQGTRISEWNETSVSPASRRPPTTRPAVSLPPQTTVPPPPPPPPPLPPPVTTQPATPTFEYENCTAAENAGATPVLRGEPGYGEHLDGDSDGVGCEG